MNTPDWVRTGETAYVLSTTLVPGVGSYETATKVEITFVGARDVRVKPHGVTTTGNETRFRVSDLTAPGTRGRWTPDDVLVEPGDPRVRVARLRLTASNATRIVSQVITDRANQLKTNMVQFDGDVVDEELRKLRAIRDAADAAISKLTQVRGAM